VKEMKRYLAESITTGRLTISNQRPAATPNYDRFLHIDRYLTQTGTVSTGVKTYGIQLDLTRDTAVLLNGDSNDQALKISIVDSVGGHATGTYLRAIDAVAKFDASGSTLTALYGGNITAYCKNGTVGSSYVLRLGMKMNGVCTNDFVGLAIQSESQGSISGDSIGLQFSTSTINPATGAVNYCMEVAPANTSGFDAFVHFTDGDKTDGSYTSLVVDADGQDSDAGIKVVIDSTAYYIPLYNASHVTGEW
jgi:hypothetical protein